MAAAKPRKPRDFRREYQRRIASGKAKGLTTSQARGHARAGERPESGPVAYDRSATLERGLRLMKQGVSQRAAAKTVGVTPERLRRFVKENTDARREGRRLVITDRRPASLNMATRGWVQSVTVPMDTASDISLHWHAVNRFLATNDLRHLAPFEGMGVMDLRGKLHPYETRPNVLRELDSIGELHFLDIYADVAK